MAVAITSGLVTSGDAVDYASSCYERGTETPLITSLMLLLRDEIDEADALAAEHHERLTPSEIEASERTWLHLCLMSLHERRHLLTDPLGAVELIYADFGYPQEISHLVRYLPTRDPKRASVDTMMRDWSLFVSTGAAEFSIRDAFPELSSM